MTRRDDKVIDVTDLAVSLRYETTSGAPRVTAVGRDAMAQRILDIAEEAGVPRYPDADLAPVLAQIPVGEEIPDGLYRAVAEVIAFAYFVAGKMPEGFEPGATQDDDDQG